MTVCSGNFAYGLARATGQFDLPMIAYMTKNAPQTKIDGVRKQGGSVRFISAVNWWSSISGATLPECDEHFINPVTDYGVLTGNASIGLELQKPLPTAKSLWASIGAGSLITGIGAAYKDRQFSPNFFAVESDHAAPATAAWAAGRVCSIPVRPSIYPQYGGPLVVPDLWPLTLSILTGTSVVTGLSLVAAMNRLFEKMKTVAEGAGAASVAAALSDSRAKGDVVCIFVAEISMQTTTCKC